MVADPIRGKGYLEIRADREKAARLGVSVGDLTDAIETALGGRVATSTVEGRERHPVRVRYARAFREDEESAREILVPTLARGPDGRPRFVRLAEVADVRIVEGPATIKGEDGMLRNYVRLNVRGRGVVDFVEEARRVVASRVRLPTGVSVAWTGQFEHEARARRTLASSCPLVLALIFAVLYWTYRDLADALLMLLAVPGSIAGGLAFQWLLGFPFTVTTWVGYIACFGMATSTGIIMLVYLREAIARAGGLEALDAGRAPLGRHRRGRAPPPAEAPDRGDHHPRPGPDALGRRPRGRGDPPDGRPGPRRPPRRRRGHRPAPARPVLPGQAARWVALKVASNILPAGPVMLP